MTGVEILQAASITLRLAEMIAEEAGDKEITEAMWADLRVDIKASMQRWRDTPSS